MSLVNVNYFREDAIHYKKYGRYDDGEPGTDYYDKFWRDRIRKSVYGYQVGDMYVSGYHYFFMNFCPIDISKKTYGTLQGEKPRNVQADRIRGFADIWDANYEFFIYCELCESGLKNIGDINFIATDMIDRLFIGEEYDDYYYGGWDGLYLKPRGVGASFMGGSMPARNFYCIPNSTSLIVADDKQFLEKDGVYTKFQSYMSFINDKTGLTKVMDAKKSASEMHFKASYINPATGIESDESFMSEVIGISLKNDVDKIRGKRAKLVAFEEAGTFANFKKAWAITDPAVRKRPVTWGFRIGYGTGGTEGAKFESMKSMFYNPIAQDILPMRNIYDPNRYNQPSALFHPCTYNVEMKDENGNSLREEVLKMEEVQRAKKMSSDDPEDLSRYCAENPLTPKEAMLSSGTNMFRPEYVTDLMGRNDAIGYTEEMAITGELRDHGMGHVTFHPNPELRPFYDYPVQAKKKRAGAVVEFDPPWRDEDGNVPPHLHYICVDPYNFDEAPTSVSVGAIYVLRNINNFAFPDDTVVAHYVGRPSSTDEFNRILFMLADYYNAFISFENEGGDIISYARRKNKIHRLFPELTLDYNEKIAKSSLRRGFGVSISGGKNNGRKTFGDSYLADWLYTERGTTEDGESVYNIDRIPDPGLLRELEVYDPEEGNFDRIAALRVGMFFKRELEWKKVVPKKGDSKLSKDKSRFFSSTLRSGQHPKLPKGTALSDIDTR